MGRSRIRLRTIWSPPLRWDPRQPAAGGRRLRVPARRFHLACHGAGCSSNRGWLDHGDRGVPTGSFPDVRAADDDDDRSRAGDELMSLVLGQTGRSPVFRRVGLVNVRSVSSLSRNKKMEWLSIFGLPNDYLITGR